MEMIVYLFFRTTNALKYLYLVVVFALISNIAISQDCLTETEIELTTTKTIPTDGSCDSPADDGLVCNVSSGDAFIDVRGTMTVLACATVNLTSSTSTRVRGDMIVADGATVTVNNALRVQNGGTLTVNGDLTVSTGNLAIPSGDLIVSASGSVTLLDGTVTLGNGGGGTSSITLNGTMDVSNNIIVNGNGTISGGGFLTFGGTMTNGGTVEGAFDGCSGSATSCGDPTLPVTWIDFSGKPASNSSELFWSTGTEINNEGFEVEKSLDGAYFDKIGFVEGHGNSTDIHEYNFTDRSISGNAYYRIKQIDFDGQFDYSNTIRVVFSELINPKIYPNPVRNSLTIEADPLALYEVSLWDITGALLFHQKYLNTKEASEILSKRFDSFNPGHYFIKMTTGFETYSTRLEKVL
ncbi:MAG: T9SS type A sorting domain-containing protein [Cyclobacteriaceae bacterium]